MYGAAGLSSLLPDGSIHYANHGDPSLDFQPYQSPPPDDDKPRFDLQDSQYDDDWIDQEAPITYPSPPAVTPHTREEILLWFNTHYASNLGEENLPERGSERPDGYGDVHCRMCQPSVAVNVNDYKQHKLDYHGFKRYHNQDVCLQPPLNVQMRKLPNNVQVFEGFCSTCRNWKPLDLGRVGYNWSEHAKQVRSPVSIRHDHSDHIVSKYNARAIHDIIR